jgi:hypothetical protein
MVKYTQGSIDKVCFQTYSLPVGTAVISDLQLKNLNGKDVWIQMLLIEFYIYFTYNTVCIYT